MKYRAAIESTRLVTYGWAAYDTEDQLSVGNARIDARRTTLANVLGTIHWAPQ